MDRRRRVTIPASFISFQSRNPLTTYISLFGHGCSKLGGMYKGFKKRGLDHLYVPTPAGFERWLEFMLEPKNAEVIKKKYAQIGLERHLRAAHLSLDDAEHRRSL